MNSTPGNWTYNEDFAEVQAQVGARTVATVTAGHDLYPTQPESHANGYLMAAAPELRDELTNLSRAVREYLDACDDEHDIQLLDNMEVMCHRAENALSHIFPPEHPS